MMTVLSPLLIQVLLVSFTTAIIISALGLIGDND